MSGTVLETLGRQVFRLGFEISPIILTGGLADLIGGGILPVVALTEGLNFVQGLLGGGSELSLDDFFAHFVPMSGSTLVSNAVGQYPFANQATAANAIISQPLNISLQMIAPAKSTGGYLIKLATMTALQLTLQNHCARGGTFVVATPAKVYTNCLLTSLRDVTPSGNKQTQMIWQWDFSQPLISLGDAATALNTLLSKMDGGLPTDGGLSGAGGTVGSSLGGAGPATIPSTSNLSGALSSGTFPASPVPSVTQVPLQ